MAPGRDTVVIPSWVMKAAGIVSATMLTGFVTWMNSIHAGLTENSRQIERVQSRIEVNEAAVKATDERILDVKGSVDRLSGKVDTLIESVAGLKAQLGVK